MRRGSEEREQGERVKRGLKRVDEMREVITESICRHCF